MSRIQHRGVVESIGHNVVNVKVQKESACAACHAKALCGEKGEDRIIEVRTTNSEEFTVGERVIVALEQGKMGLTSLLWAYILPLAVLLGVLFTAHALGFSDGPAAIASIVAIAIYYVALYLIRGYIERKIKFTIIKE